MKRSEFKRELKQFLEAECSTSWIDEANICGGYDGEGCIHEDLYEKLLTFIEDKGMAPPYSLTNVDFQNGDRSWESEDE